MSRTIAERLGNQDEFYRLLGENFSNNLRVSIPGIIQAFDYNTQTATVKVALREKIRNKDLSVSWVDIPLLLDVPVVLPHAGGFTLTMPVNKGDECLVVFADMCIDAWFAHGGIQNQMEKRRHDLSDGFAILGTWSQPNKIPNYSRDSAQLRTNDGNTYVSVKPGEINLVATSVKVNGTPI